MFVCLLPGLCTDCLTDFHKLGEKLARGKIPLDYDDIPDHVTLGLGLEYVRLLLGGGHHHTAIRRLFN